MQELNEKVFLDGVRVLLRQSMTERIGTHAGNDIHNSRLLGLNSRVVRYRVVVTDLYGNARNCLGMQFNNQDSAESYKTKIEMSDISNKAKIETILY